MLGLCGGVCAIFFVFSLICRRQISDQKGSPPKHTPKPKRGSRTSNPQPDRARFLKPRKGRRSKIRRAGLPHPPVITVIPPAPSSTPPSSRQPGHNEAPGMAPGDRQCFWLGLVCFVRAIHSLRPLYESMAPKWAYPQSASFPWVSGPPTFLLPSQGSIGRHPLWFGWSLAEFDFLHGHHALQGTLACIGGRGGIRLEARDQLF